MAYSPQPAGYGGSAANVDDGRLYGIKKDTLIKLAVVAATIFIVGVILASEIDGFDKLMDRGINYWSYSGSKRRAIGQNFTGLCVGLLLLGGLNAFVLSRKESFNTQLVLLKEVSDGSGVQSSKLSEIKGAGSKSDLINTAKNYSKDQVEQLIKIIDENSESQRMSTIKALLKRCGKGEFKSMERSRINDIIDKEEKNARRRVYLAMAIAVVATVLFITMASLSLSSMAYITHGYSWHKRWTINAGIFITGAVSAAVSGLSIGYLLGRYKKYKDNDDSLRSSAVQ